MLKPQPVPETPTAPAPEPHVRIADLTKTYEIDGGASRIDALGPVTQDITKGEIFTVVGPSGCGKSTLLDVIAGLQKPSAGSVSFEGREVTGKVPDGIGVVFQEDASFPWLTVRENIAFGLRRLGVDKAEIETRVEDALKLVGLADFARAYPGQLSGGMKQRTCIARTLVMQPRMILLDEPFGALDQQTRLIMNDEILDMWRRTGATVFLITHSLDEAVVLADRVGIMSARPGRFIEVIETGWPADRTTDGVFRDPHFGELTGHVWSLLKDESTKIMGGTA